MTILEIMLWPLSLVFLVFSCDRMISALRRIAACLHWREFVVSFLLVALATSTPELFVGLTSALAQAPAISLGNILGANIINATIIVGIAALLGRRLPVPEVIGLKEMFFSGFSAVLPVVLILDGTLSRFDGAALLALSAFYFLFVYEKRQEFRKRMDSASKREIFTALLTFVLWTAALLIVSRFLVGLSVKAANELGLSLFLVGLIIISLGTTLPEAIFGLRSVSKGSGSFVFGNLFGTLIVNSGIILGAVSLINPITAVNPRQVFFSGLALLFSLVLLFTFLRSGKKLTWREGAILIAVYALSVASQYLIR